MPKTSKEIVSFAFKSSDLKEVRPFESGAHVGGPWPLRRKDGARVKKNRDREGGTRGLGFGL